MALERAANLISGFGGPVGQRERQGEERRRKISNSLPSFFENQSDFIATGLYHKDNKNALKMFILRVLLCCFYSNSYKQIFLICV